jgi:hypothetical protein
MVKFLTMTNLELDDDEKAVLVALLRAEVKNKRWPMAPPYEGAAIRSRQAGTAATAAGNLPGAEAGRRAEHGAGAEEAAALTANFIPDLDGPPVCRRCHAKTAKVTPRGTMR